jgi:hypothetical protein
MAKYVICNGQKYAISKRMKSAGYFSTLLEFTVLDPRYKEYQVITMYQKEFLKLNREKVCFDYENIYSLILIAKAIDYFMDNNINTKDLSKCIVSEMSILSLKQLINLRKWYINSTDGIILKHWQDWIAGSIDYACGTRKQKYTYPVISFSSLPVVTKELNQIFRSLTELKEYELIEFWNKTIYARELSSSIEFFEKTILLAKTIPGVAIDWTDLDDSKLFTIDEHENYGSIIKFQRYKQEQLNAFANPLFKANFYSNNYVISLKDLPIESYMIYNTKNKYITNSWYTSTPNNTLDKWFSHSIYQLHSIQISSS